MKLAKLGLVGGMIATMTITAMPVAAQEVWIYQAVSPNNAIAIYPAPPVDIAYPADGSSARVISGGSSSQHEILLTPQEEARRLQSPQIIIDTVPISLARSLSFPPASHTNATSLP